MLVLSPADEKEIKEFCGNIRKAQKEQEIDPEYYAPPETPWLEEMRSITGPTMVTFISLGINADLRRYPERPMFKLKKPINLDNQAYRYLSACKYAADSNYSPNGKTAMTIQLPGDTYDFWKKAKEENRYGEEKQKIAQQIIEAISAQFPEADGKIEVCDIATPLTYERYCGNWKGSWMTEIKADMRKEPYPPTIEGLGGVYFAGQRMMPLGGLPAALITGQIDVQQLCRDMDIAFIEWG